LDSSELLCYPSLSTLYDEGHPQEHPNRLHHLPTHTAHNYLLAKTQKYWNALLSYGFISWAIHTQKFKKGFTLMATSGLMWWQLNSLAFHSASQIRAASRPGHLVSHSTFNHQQKVKDVKAIPLLIMRVIQ
jgi:hypothetical protein